jgi:ABC-type multidrug transport system fused ATPase/permease subunit
MQGNIWLRYVSSHHERVSTGLNPGHKIAHLSFHPPLHLENLAREVLARDQQMDPNQLYLASGEDLEVDWDRIAGLDRRLDPTSSQFDFEAWSRAVTSFRRHFKLTRPARAALLFRNLTVRGNGPRFAVQETVGSMLLSGFGITKLFRKRRCRTILGGVDGVIHKGELLLVLGRPGSGCSTFLKTITGEVDGLEVAKESAVQYSGGFPTGVAAGGRTSPV